MSEVTEINPSEISLPGVESLYMDPKLAGTLKKIGMYNALLSSEWVTEDEITEIIGEIDGEWQLLLRCPAQFTGVIEYIDNLEEDERVVSRYLEDETVTFAGVYARSTETKTDDESLAHYDLKIGVYWQSLDADGDFITFGGTVASDMIGTLEFPNTMSVERARWILQELQCELIEGIDCALLNEAEDEGERAIRLAGLSYEPLEDEEQDKMVRVALEIYTNDLLRFDMQNGYAIWVEGDMWVINQDGSLTPGQSQGNGLASISRIKWLETTDGEGVFTPHLDAFLCDEELTDISEQTHLYVPATTITNLQSLRRMFFAPTGE